MTFNPVNNDRANMVGSFPESWVLKSDKQEKLERQGCVFRGQEYLDNHEIDPSKPCYCNRPNKG